MDKIIGKLKNNWLFNENDNLTALEMVGNIILKMNEVVDTTITYTDIVEELRNWSNNLSVNNEVSTKINDLVKNGTLKRIINDDLLSEINGQLSQRATKSELEVEKARINNLVANASNTEENAELIDIRIGANGVIYPSASEAVRNQINLISTDIHTITDGGNLYNPNNDNTGLLNNDGTINVLDEYFYSEFINVGSKNFTIEAISFIEGETLRVGYYNSNNLESFVSRETVSIPSNGAKINKENKYPYIIISAKKESQKTLKIYTQELSAVDKIAREGSVLLDKYNTGKNNFTIGAIFYNGWGGKWGGNGIKEWLDASQTMYQNSTFYDANYPDWCEYVRHVDGEYPPEQVSFANYFPQEIVKQGYPELESQKPLNSYNGVSLGWRNTGSVSQITAQIDMANAYGLDYWAIMVSCIDEYFNEDNTLNEDLFFMHNPHLKYYLESPSQYKLKFCIMTGMIPSTDKLVHNYVEWIYNKLMTNSNYLYMDNSPVLLVYGSEGYGNYDSLYAPHNRIKNIKLIGYNYETNKPNGKFAYAGYTKRLTNVTEYVNSTFEDNIGKWNIEYIDKNFSEKDGIIFLPMNGGRRESARSGFTTNKQDFAIPTKAEYLNELKAVIDFGKNMKVPERTILIYAWNEFTEGSWLMPTQADIDKGRGYYRLETIKEAKTYWESLNV